MCAWSVRLGAPTPRAESSGTRQGRAPATDGLPPLRMKGRRSVKGPGGFTLLSPPPPPVDPGLYTGTPTHLRPLRPRRCPVLLAASWAGSARCVAEGPARCWRGNSGALAPRPRSTGCLHPAALPLASHSEVGKRTLSPANATAAPASYSRWRRRGWAGPQGGSQPLRRGRPCPQTPPSPRARREPQ